MCECRRDRGETPIPAKKINYIHATSGNDIDTSDAYIFGETTFVFAVPAILHILGFLTACYVFRVADNEQLQCLVERVS